MSWFSRLFAAAAAALMTSSCVCTPVQCADAVCACLPAGGALAAVREQRLDVDESGPPRRATVERGLCF